MLIDHSIFVINIFEYTNSSCSLYVIYQVRAIFLRIQQHFSASRGDFPPASWFIQRSRSDPANTLWPHQISLMSWEIGKLSPLMDPKILWRLSRIWSDLNQLETLFLSVYLDHSIFQPETSSFWVSNQVNVKWKIEMDWRGGNDVWLIRNRREQINWMIFVRVDLVLSSTLYTVFSSFHSSQNRVLFCWELVTGIPSKRDDSNEKTVRSHKEEKGPSTEFHSCYRVDWSTWNYDYRNTRK